MENATKALMIAASVLIVIVIIAVGIRILSPLSDTAEQVGRTSTALEISIYNSQFTKFEGQQKGSAVNSLIRLVNQNNKDESNNKITYTKPDKIEVNKTYNVEFTEFTDEGYVKTINITG